MVRVNVVCEGGSEELFIKRVLREHFYSFGIYLEPHLIKKSGGGITRYGAFTKEVSNLCKSDTTAKVTTFIDYYRLGSTYEKIETGDIITRVRAVEDFIKLGVPETNFIVNVMMHEFEALLFSDPKKFESYFDSKAIEKLLKISNDYETPEHINDSDETKPSKRIEKIYGKKFPKTTIGVNIAKKIGLVKMREECSHFNGWIEMLEGLG